MSEITYGQLFDKAWDAIKKNLALSAGLTLVYILAAAAFNFIPVVGGFLGGLLTPGYIYCLVRIRDHQNIDFKDFFWSFQDFNRLLHWLVMYIVKAIAVVIGIILLIIPGIYLAVALALSESYFVFRKQDGIEALKASAKLVTNHWWFMFGLILLLIFFNIIGLVCFVVGVFVTIPTSFLMLLYAMEALEKINVLEEPKTVS